MRKRQLGLTLTGLIISAFLLVIVALLAMKVVPPYMEFYTAKKLITTIAAEGKTTVGEIRVAWDLKSSIDDVTVIKSSDLEITKEGGEVVISFAYRKEIPLVGNAGIYLDFAANSKAREIAP